MQGLATSTDRVSLTFPAPRNQSACLKKHLKPTRVCFSSSASFPISRISPLLANNFASSSSFNHIFAHDRRRLTKHVTASNDENSLTTEAANILRNKLFIVFSCLGFLWLVMKKHVPYFFGYYMTVGLLLGTSEFFHGINFTRRLRIYYIMLAGFSCTHAVVHFLFPMIVTCLVYLAAYILFFFKLLGLAPGIY